MPRFHELAVAGIRKETAACVSLRLELPEALRATFAFTPGQHLILRATVDGTELRRTYSVCAGVDEGELRIAVKRQPGGRFSTFVNERLRVGDRLLVMPPAGRFFTPLDAGAARLHVAFAAGSGITPVLSILKTVLVREPDSRFVLVYGNRTADGIIFREELLDLKNRHIGRLGLHFVLSGEPEELSLLAGRIDADRVRRFCAGIIRPEEVGAWLVCGPAPMIGDVSAALEGLGVDRRKIHVEFFTAAGNAPRGSLHGPPVVEATGEACRLTVIAQGQRRELDLPFNDLSILDAALAAGVDLPFACKGGVCCTCRCRLIAGRVAMAANYALEEQEVERGYILACQSHPLTDRVIVDYDQP
jgi:ring-1,2-phenylacetyl-CoA epoxidase subunit PaaE